MIRLFEVSYVGFKYPTEQLRQSTTEELLGDNWQVVQGLGQSSHLFVEVSVYIYVDEQLVRQLLPSR